MEEIWKDIPNYDGLYQVSNLGNVKSLNRYVRTCGNAKRLVKEKILKATLDNTGYYVVGLYKNNIQSNYHIHRLVIEAFIPNTQNKPQVNHIDGNKLNNCLDNLEWCTASENGIHAYNHNLNKSRKEINQYDLGGNFVKKWDSIKDAQAFYKTTHISECCHHKRKQCKDYIWRYANE